ncbi:MULTISPECIES: hypothetical protein [Nitrosomonas]|uniref:hypothetical protein n=1 Tax=Nitrosomonas TaxID=914 RepID=UPI00115F7AA0|nr:MULTISPECIES: hypothetical protein [Nitrosomonas]
MRFRHPEMVGWCPADDKAQSVHLGIQELRQVKERGFWKVMWPKMRLMAIMFDLWVLLPMWIF